MQIFCSTQFCIELPKESLLMSKNIALKGHTLKIMCTKCMKKMPQKDFFDFKST
jgi:hypothetical protein